MPSDPKVNPPPPPDETDCEETPFERFEGLARKILQVPKSEADEQEAAYRASKPSPKPITQKSPRRP